MELLSFLEKQKICYEQNIPLSRRTWIKTGGICACWITPISVTQLTKVCRYLYANDITFELVGQTSNIFFHSTHNPHVIVSTTKVNNYIIKNNVITSDCGVSVIKLAKDCLSQGYAGFYGLVGLPGTVASALVNNAGCFSCSISSILISAEVLLADGTIQTIKKDDFRFNHRSSAFKQGKKKGVILSVKLKVDKAENIEEEYKKSEKTKEYRNHFQEGPRLNLGSVYSSKILKRNVKNLFVLIISHILSGLKIMPKRKAFKNVLLYLYGYRDICSYISDKNVNTFIWHDDRAEVLFNRYKQLMSKAYDNTMIEIEEKY